MTAPAAAGAAATERCITAGRSAAGAKAAAEPSRQRKARAPFMILCATRSREPLPGMHRVAACRREDERGGGGGSRHAAAGDGGGWTRLCVCVRVCGRHAKSAARRQAMRRLGSGVG
uniref:Uncharacterized protein n=1 Tax=Emiliania huxleyi TaxID=2903 RepID=A0A7S3TU86_EMIHU